MTNEEAIEILTKHNAWRRGEPPYHEEVPHPIPVKPSELGLAIDIAIQVMRTVSGAKIRHEDDNK